jgi:hypothetical protein
MYLITKFKLFENKIFGVKDLDYIDSFTEIFNVFSKMKDFKLIDEDGKLIVDIDFIGTKLPEFDDMFDTEDEYYEMLFIVKDIIDKYYKKI